MLVGSYRGAYAIRGGNLGSLACYSLPRLSCCRRGCSTHSDCPATCVDWRLAARIITYSRVLWAINSFVPYKNLGMVAIFPALLQEKLEILITWLGSFVPAWRLVMFQPSGARPR